MNSMITSESSVAQKHVLTFPNFRLLWFGQALSTFGDKFTEIAIPIFVYNLTGSALQLGLAFIVQIIAALLFSLVAGALTDRWDRRRTMIVADLLRAIIIFAILMIPLLPGSVSTQLFFLYSLSFLAAAVKEFFLPAKVAAIPDTVDRSQLMAANSLDQSTMTLVGFVGFAMAGAVIGWLGIGIAFWIDSGTFLLSAVVIGMMRLTSAQTSKDHAKESVLADIMAGLKHVWSMPILRGTVLLSLFAPLALGATQPLLLVFARQVLRSGDLGFGLLEGAFGLGIAFGAFLLGRKAESVPRGRLLAIGVLGMGMGQVAAVAIPLALNIMVDATTVLLMAVSLPFFFLGAAGNAAVLIGIRTIIQENAPREMIGRVFSVITVVSSAAIALGAILAGLADIFGVGLVLLGWGVFLTVVGLIVGTWKTFQEA